METKRPDQLQQGVHALRWWESVLCVVRSRASVARKPGLKRAPTAWTSAVDSACYRRDVCEAVNFGGPGPLASGPSTLARSTPLARPTHCGRNSKRGEPDNAVPPSGLNCI